MTILAAGAVAGLGLLLLVVVLLPPGSRPAGALARLDALRASRRLESVTLEGAGETEDGGWVRSLGRRTDDLLGGAGLDLRGLRSDLALLGRSTDTFLAWTVLAAVAGFLLPLAVAVELMVVGVRAGGALPLVFPLVGAAIGAALPLASVRARAAERRRDFRHVVGSFLDLVAMSLAGGRGVPEALQGASALSDGWAMVRIRDTLSAARLRGETPWAALGALGEQVRVEELRDLAAALSLVAEDGAKVRDSLSARASSMRRRELAESEGKAGEASQSMLVAQLLLSLGFLIFLIYPALMKVMGGL